MIGETISFSERFTIKRNQIRIVEDEKKTDKLLQDIVDARTRLAEAEKQYKINKNETNKHYREELAKVEEEFKLALFEEYRMENNPKREKMFSIAWEKGHSDGYNGVESEFSTLVELMQWGNKYG